MDREWVKCSLFTRRCTFDPQRITILIRFLGEVYTDSNPLVSQFAFLCPAPPHHRPKSNPLPHVTITNRFNSYKLLCLLRCHLHLEPNVVFFPIGCQVHAGSCGEGNRNTGTLTIPVAIRGNGYTRQRSEHEVRGFRIGS